MKDNFEKISEFTILKSLNVKDNKSWLNNNKTGFFIYFKKAFILFIILFLFIFILFNIIFSDKEKLNLDSLRKKNFEKNFDYHRYEKELITEKIQKYAGYEQNDNEPYFLNGIIRKFKPKKCLEIGVAKGGSSVIILNALKDINKSFLISLDIRENYYINQSLKTGFIVKKYFSELANNKWRLYTGKQPHIFLSKLNLKFDFLFLDTVHLNILEVLPFLENSAIVVLHDIIFHFPSCNYYKN